MHSRSVRLRLIESATDHFAARVMMIEMIPTNTRKPNMPRTNARARLEGGAGIHWDDLTLGSLSAGSPVIRPRAAVHVDGALSADGDGGPGPGALSQPRAVQKGPAGFETWPPLGGPSVISLGFT